MQFGKVTIQWKCSILLHNMLHNIDDGHQFVIGWKAGRHPRSILRFSAEAIIKGNNCRYLAQDGLPQKLKTIGWPNSDLNALLL